MSTSWKRLIVGDLSWRRLATSLLSIYAAVATWAWFALDGLVFLPQPSSYQDGPALTRLQCADGTPITAAWLPRPTARYTLLYSHGNAEDLGENLPLMRHLGELGFNVLIYDYPGYGTSAGTAGERSSVQAIEAAYAHLTGQLGIPAERIIGYGRSVGGGPTLALASRKPLGALVLESSFTDPVSVRIPVRILPFVMFPSLQRLRTLPLPVLVMHGLADELIPPEHGKALYEAAPGPKFNLWVPGAGHDDFKEVAGSAYDKALQDFARYLANLNRGASRGLAAAPWAIAPWPTRPPRS